MFTKGVTVFSLVCLALAALAACPAAAQGQWAVETLSTARYLLTAASVRDEVIFAGGVAGSSQSCTVDRHSAAMDSWTQECLSAARSWLSAASVSWPAPSKAAFAVFAGGLTSSTVASNRVDIFNAETLSWTVSPVSLSIPRFAMAAASLDSLALVFFAGGRDAGGSGLVHATVDVLKFTSSGGVSASVLNMSVPRHALTAAALPLQSIVMFAGGMTSAGSSSSVVDIYDAGTQSWTIGSLSVARLYLAATTLVQFSLVFFAGGWAGTQSVGNCSKVVDIYNGATKTWSQATLSVARHLLSAAALDVQGIAVFAGGLKSASSSFAGQYSNDVDIFTASTGSWTVRTLTTARSFLVSAVLPLRGILYFGGGFTGTTSNQIDVWDVRTDSLGSMLPTLTLSNPARGGTGISMTLTMTPASPVPVNGKIVVNLPGAFNCSDGTPVFFSPRGNPLRTGSVSLLGSLLTITILSGNLLGGQAFSISFTGVTNPIAPQAFSSAVNAATLNENGFTIGSSSVGTLVAVVPNLGLSYPSISLSSVLASKKQVTMTITLLPELSIPSNGRLLVTLAGQGWSLPESSLAVFLLPSSGATAAVSLLDSNNASSVLMVQFLSGSYLAHEIVSFSVSGLTNPPLGQAPATTEPPKPPPPLQTQSAITDIYGIIVGASVRGTLPAIIDALGCGADSYFFEVELACISCASGKGAPAGSTSASACKDRVDIVGISVGIAVCGLVFIIAVVARHRLVWSQRHKLFELLADSHRKRLLMKETSTLRRTGDATKSYPINDIEHPTLYAFIEEKMNLLQSPIDAPRPDGTKRKIVGVELCRASREDTFFNNFFDGARTEVKMAKSLKFQPPESTRPEYEEFQASLKAYEKFCENIDPNAKIDSKSLAMTTAETGNSSQPEPGIKLMFAWHAGHSKDAKSIIDSGVMQVAISTDPGFFGKGSYFSPHFDYAERYARWHPSVDKDGKKCYAVILWACMVPLTPYVITKYDYPKKEPPLRDADIPYGFCKFYGRPMQRACSAHFVSTKQYNVYDNPLYSMWTECQDTLPDSLRKLMDRKKYIETTSVISGRETKCLQHVCVVCPKLPENWIEEIDQGLTTYVNRNDNSRHVSPPPVVNLPQTIKHAEDQDKIPFELQLNLDYQYCREQDSEGHELVLQDHAMALPIAVVWVTFERFEPQPSASPLHVHVLEEQSQLPGVPLTVYEQSPPPFAPPRPPPIGGFPGFSRNVLGAQVVSVENVAYGPASSIPAGDASHPGFLQRPSASAPAVT